MDKKTDIMNIAIIPARKGSKRLINKNKKLLNDKPLIYYSIKFALKNTFDLIIVSSDDDEIIEFSSKYPVKVHKRSSSLSKDETPIISLLKNIIDEFKFAKTDLLCLLQPTSPLRDINLFNLALRKINKEKGDSLITISSLKKKIGHVENSLFIPKYKVGGRSQEINDLFYENGVLYLLKVNQILKNKLFGESINYLLIDDHFPIVDIDLDHDFELCKVMFQKNQELFKYLIE